MSAMKKITQTLLDRMRSSLQTLSPAEKRVAMTLIADFPITGLKTLVEIASAAGVSAATVSRFTETIGFSSFPEFQRALHGDVVARFSSPGALFERLPGPAPDAGDPANSTRLFSRLISQTMDSLNMDEVRSFVEKLADPKRTIYFLGGRQSTSIARYFQQLLHNVRSKTVFIETVDTAAIDMLLELDARATLVAFDFRRYQQDTADFVQAADARKAQIVLITDPYMSPAVKFASQAFICHTETGFPFDGYTSALALVDFFMHQIFVTSGEKVHDRISRLESVREEFGLEYVLKQ
jgi:DNA-binding MurR/RpiR family transcriptional regulator